MALTYQTPGGACIITATTPAARYSRQLSGGPFYIGNYTAPTGGGRSLASWGQHLVGGYFWDEEY